VIYITISQAIETHRETVKVSGGGDVGIIEIGKLESVLEHIQNDDYYPNFEDKLTHLFFCANKFHSFTDGNKRIAITLSAQFMLLNGYMYAVGRFMREMENISYHVAAGKIDKELLSEIILAIIEDNTENEELKMKIYNAIKDGE